MKKQKQAAIEAISRHFSATWEKGEDPPDAYLRIARKRIAIEVAILKATARGAGRADEASPAVRSGRAQSVRRLQAALSEAVPEGKTLIVTITAPIWEPAKTAGALEEVIRPVSRAGRAQVEAKDTIHDNQIRVRL